MLVVSANGRAVAVRKAVRQFTGTLSFSDSALKIMMPSSEPTRVDNDFPAASNAS